MNLAIESSSFSFKQQQTHKVGKYLRSSPGEDSIQYEDLPLMCYYVLLLMFYLQGGEGRSKEGGKISLELVDEHTVLGVEALEALNIFSRLFQGVTWRTNFPIVAIFDILND